jgi:hypothetical protein
LKCKKNGKQFRVHGRLVKGGRRMKISLLKAKGYTPGLFTSIRLLFCIQAAWEKYGAGGVYSTWMVRGVFMSDLMVLFGENPDFQTRGEGVFLIRFVKLIFESD